ncbi:CopG family transcriptional regulator [Pseudomonas sichuanensis]|uniref:CopG family transcriptional regulator n=1 Tax=Pseudomonas sichuanensis TaxID=2213015 RepID=UPI00244A18AB|nr:CopG family transcriptional regulator [Pseudomonas sichuanensis]MDH0729209.1 CopG family transcriptional regulator [Pseudomonas sichuanensis]MDH1581411.1 CopG family transcriptional regulator [Pseudomonas sichuanensis]MDH1593881.1 CopG family transcriptional regulator [Pseudomonas sichuanensis]MDH1600009.1 CopG family transcriptional regulator [Pseudomonas sichuanensis]
MNRNAKTRSVTAHIPVELAERVDEVDTRLTREALADVDAGRVIDHQAVQAWADSMSRAAPLPVPR